MNSLSQCYMLGSRLLNLLLFVWAIPLYNKPIADSMIKLIPSRLFVMREFLSELNFSSDIIDSLNQIFALTVKIREEAELGGESALNYEELSYLSGDIMSKLRTQIEVNYDDLHADTFALSLHLLDIGRFFIKAKGEAREAETPFAEYIYLGNNYQSICIHLNKIVQIIDDLHISDTTKKDFIALSTSFIQKKCDNNSITEFEFAILHTFPSKFGQDYSLMIPLVIGSKDKRTGFNIDKLLVEAFRLGKLTGNFNLIIESNTRNSNKSDLLNYKNRIEYLLLRFKIDPENEFKEIYSSFVNNNDSLTNSEEISSKFYHVIVCRISELFLCHYGLQISNLFHVAFYFGQALFHFNKIQTTNTEVSSKYTVLITEENQYRITNKVIDQFVKWLGKLPITDELITKVNELITIWKSCDSKKIQLSGLRTYFNNEFEDEILGEVKGNLLKERPALPDNYSHLSESVALFLEDHPNYTRNIFLIMRIRDSQPFKDIYKTIKTHLKTYNLNVLRADEKIYPDDDDLWDNVCTYMIGCKHCIVIVENLEDGLISSNVILELGFMTALKKRCLLFKEKNTTIPSDMIWKYYRTFDKDNTEGSLIEELDNWLVDIGFKQS